MKIRNTFALAAAAALAGCGGASDDNATDGPVGDEAKLVAPEGQYGTTMQMYSVKGDSPEVEMLENMKNQVSQYSVCLDAENRENTLLAALAAQKWEGCTQTEIGPHSSAESMATATLTCVGGDGVESTVVANGGVYESGNGFSFGVVRTVTNPETGATIETGHRLEGTRKGDC